MWVSKPTLSPYPQINKEGVTPASYIALIFESEQSPHFSRIAFIGYVVGTILAVTIFIILLLLCCDGDQYNNESGKPDNCNGISVRVNESNRWLAHFIRKKSRNVNDEVKS